MLRGGAQIFHSLHIVIMPKVKDSLARRHAVVLHFTQVGKNVMKPVTCSTAGTVEPLPSAGEKVQISWDPAARKGVGGPDKLHVL